MAELTLDIARKILDAALAKGVEVDPAAKLHARRSGVDRSMTSNVDTQ